MRSRGVAVVAAIALLIGLSPATAICVGWDVSPTARMACCAKVHGRVPIAKADACCQAGEQRAHGQPQGGVLAVVLPDTTVVGVIAAPAPRRLPQRDVPHTRAPEVATHLLLAVFLL